MAPRQTGREVLADAVGIVHPGAQALLVYLLEIRVNRRTRRTLGNIRSAVARGSQSKVPRWLQLIEDALFNLYRLSLDLSIYQTWFVFHIDLTYFPHCIPIIHSWLLVCVGCELEILKDGVVMYRLISCFTFGHLCSVYAIFRLQMVRCGRPSLLGWLCWQRFGCDTCIIVLYVCFVQNLISA